MWWVWEVGPAVTRLPPQVLVGSGAPGPRAPCPAAAATGTAPEAVASMTLWSSRPAGGGPAQVRAVPTSPLRPDPQ